MSAPRNAAIAMRNATRPAIKLRTKSSGSDAISVQPKAKSKLHPKTSKLSFDSSKNSSHSRVLSPKSSSVIEISPDQVESLIRANTGARKFRQNVEIAAKINNDPFKSRFLNRRLYLALLGSLAADADRKNVPLALQLFQEYIGYDIDPAEFFKASQMLYECFKNCTDFTQLLSLRIVFQSIIYPVDPSKAAAACYHACHMRVLLNTNQNALSLDHFLQCLEQANGSSEKALLLRAMPVKKQLDALIDAHDCESIHLLLEELFLVDCADLISTSDWSEVLGLALAKNDYDLVKMIYQKVIMCGLDSVDSADISMSPQGLQNNTILSTLTENTLAQILHTLATHGDVSSCLHLIEWHYIHLPLRGEKALTKEMCLQVIRAYCFYHPEPGEYAKYNEKDSSVETVLEVIDSFVSKKRHTFIHADLAEAFSHKLSTYHVFDANVAHARSKETTVPLAPYKYDPFEEEPIEEEVLLKKKSNRNLHASAQGSVLKNTETLSAFVAEHWQYVLNQPYSEETRQIFFECLLWHLATYQNTTGVVLALQTMKNIDNRLVEKWLSRPSYDIILRSVSESPAAMATGLVLFEHMKARQIPLSAQNFKYFIFSSLRGDSYNSLLEYYVYEYLQSQPETISPHLLRRLRSFKRLNDEGRILLRFLEDYSPTDFGKIDTFWDSHQFSRSSPSISDSDQEYARYFSIDQRDKKMLEQVLS